jgi:hypothetical protein
VRGTSTAWLIVSEDAEKMRRFAGKVRDPRLSGIVRMAANILEQAGWELMTGRVTMNTIESLGIVERLLASSRLPVEPVRRAIRLARMSIGARMNGLVSLDEKVIALP